jgi:hypothetical protein
MPEEAPEDYETDGQAFSRAAGLLIRSHYRTMGAYSWTREDFLRLCAAWEETPREVAERIGMSPSRLKSMLSNINFQFSGSEGILLSMHHRYISNLRTGSRPKGELFPAFGCTKEVAK